MSDCSTSPDLTGYIHLFDCPTAAWAVACCSACGQVGPQRMPVDFRLYTDLFEHLIAEHGLPRLPESVRYFN